VFLAKFRFQQSQKSNFKPKNKPQEYNKKKEERNNCIRKFEMLFHEYEIFNVKSVVQKTSPKAI
jgi:hypothetical protein